MVAAAEEVAAGWRAVLWARAHPLVGEPARTARPGAAGSRLRLNWGHGASRRPQNSRAPVRVAYAVAAHGPAVPGDANVETARVGAVGRVLATGVAARRAHVKAHACSKRCGVRESGHVGGKHLRRRSLTRKSRRRRPAGSRRGTSAPSRSGSGRRSSRRTRRGSRRRTSWPSRRRCRCRRRTRACSPAGSSSTSPCAAERRATEKAGPALSAGAANNCSTRSVPIVRSARRPNAPRALAHAVDDAAGGWRRRDAAGAGGVAGVNQPVAVVVQPVGAARLDRHAAVAAQRDGRVRVVAGDELQRKALSRRVELAALQGAQGNGTVEQHTGQGWHAGGLVR